MKKNLVGNIVIGILGLITIFLLIVWWQTANSPEKKSLENEVIDLKSDISSYKDEKENYTVDKVNEKITSDEINVSEQISKKKSDIEKAITQVYEGTKTEDEYNKLSEVLPPMIGDEFGALLMELDKPRLNQSGKAQLAYDKLLDLNIAFGEYDVNSNQVDCYVLVNYQSPIVESNVSGTKDEKLSRIQGQDFFIFSYSLKEDSIHSIQHQRNIEGGVSVDE